MFSNVFAWSIEDFVVNWNGEPESTEVVVASGEFYRTLGVVAAGAALFARNLHVILASDAGFQRENGMVVSMDALSTGREGDRLASFYAQMLDELRALPGVASASLSYVPPVSDNLGSWTQSIGIDGAPVRQDVNTTFFNAVWDDYFRTLGILRLRGRDFTPNDRDGESRVAIVNESLAHAYFPDQDPIGRLISIGRNTARRDLRIVGVVGDTKYRKLQDGPDLGLRGSGS